MQKANAVQKMSCGENRYECPYCKKEFEYLDAYYQKDGFKKIKADIFVCPDCKQEFKIR